MTPIGDMRGRNSDRHGEPRHKVHIHVSTVDGAFRKIGVTAVATRFQPVGRLAGTGWLRPQNLGSVEMGQVPPVNRPADPHLFGRGLDGQFAG